MSPKTLKVWAWRWSLLSLGALLIPWQLNAAGTWTKLVHDAPGTVDLMILLSDGTVMGCDPGSDIEVSTRTWYKLTPDIHGSYTNGTWSSVAHMHDSRLWFSSVVLRDGRLFVAGGEYGSGGATAEIYDPLFDIWTQIPVPTSLLDPNQNSPDTGKPQAFLDSSSMTLSNGSVLIYPVSPSTSSGTLIYDPKANKWTSGPQTLNFQDEATWIKLPDDSILTVDPDSTNSERFLSSLNDWYSDANLPVSLYATLQGFVGETGPALLLADGRAFFLGGSGKTALYTPKGNNGDGKWNAGPDIPFELTAADASGAIMVNGKVLCTAAPAPSSNGSSVQFPSPTSFFEFDPQSNTLAPVSGPTGMTDNLPTYKTAMLVLPDGTILYSHHNNQLYVYQPDGTPLQSAKPTITGLSWNPDGSLHLTGTQLNGLSQGASFGDDLQMDSNYPLVRLSDGSGDVLYARTHDWSSSSVRTGNKPVTTEVTLPPFLAAGPYSLVAVANGVSSDPITFNEPIWVDFNYFGFQFGTYSFPYQTLAQGISAVPTGGTIAIRSAGSSSEKMTIKKPMKIISIAGAATIGR